MQLGCHPVAVEQNTFTYKQYKEQQNKTEHPERNIHNFKNNSKNT